jgi:hypothetical protein
MLQKINVSPIAWHHYLYCGRGTLVRSMGEGHAGRKSKNIAFYSRYNPQGLTENAAATDE